MPIYEYRCDECGAEFEVTQGMDEKPVDSCNKCAGHVQRLISFTSFSLKGNGWYSDGYTTGKAAPKGAEKSAKKPKKEESSSKCATTTVGKGD
jgi:putative FmdB family regulatory protein